jgi:hypothetical protein
MMFVSSRRWLASQPCPFVIYEKAAGAGAGRPLLPGSHVVADNVGKEVSAYLSFIVEYYDALPESMLFLHSHRYSDKRWRMRGGMSLS